MTRVLHKEIRGCRDCPLSIFRGGGWCCDNRVLMTPPRHITDAEMKGEPPDWCPLPKKESEASDAD